MNTKDINKFDDNEIEELDFQLRDKIETIVSKKKKKLGEKYNDKFLSDSLIEAHVFNNIINDIKSSLYDSISEFEKQNGIQLIHKKDLCARINCEKIMWYEEFWDTENLAKFKKEIESKEIYIRSIANDVMIRMCLDENFNLDNYLSDFASSVESDLS